LSEAKKFLGQGPLFTFLFGGAKRKKEEKKYNYSFFSFRYIKTTPIPIRLANKPVCRKVKFVIFFYFKTTILKKPSSIFIEDKSKIIESRIIL